MGALHKHDIQLTFSLTNIFYVLVSQGALNILRERKNYAELTQNITNNITMAYGIPSPEKKFCSHVS
jgi:hypothetical protein